VLAVIKRSLAERPLPDLCDDAFFNDLPGFFRSIN
jgi:hypothetical protein